MSEKTTKHEEAYLRFLKEKYRNRIKEQDLRKEKFDKHVITQYEKILSSLQEKATEIDKLKEEIGKLKKEISSTQVETKKIKDDYDGLKDDKIKIIEIIGIFVAIFTFISVEFSLLKTATFNQLASLTLILGGTMILFLLFVDNITTRFIDSSKIPSKQKQIIIGLFSFALILLGLSYAYMMSKPGFLININSCNDCTKLQTTKTNTLPTRR